MKLKYLTSAALLCAAKSAHAGDAHAPHSDYRGDAGPQAWGALDASFAGCKLGHEQSPIDIHGARKGHLAPLALDYHAAPADIVNNGHTVQVNLADAGALMLDGVPYQLVQFHFHTPSEEHVDGKAYPMVAHLVHKSADGKLAVVAVLLKQGKANAALKPVFDGLPPAANDMAALAAPFNVADLLPSDRGYYKFMGSLTTPPCSEGVQWQVLKQPVEVSRDQIRMFQKLYKANARPIQPLNKRTIEQT
jgi:carbonic anhydrase